MKRVLVIDDNSKNLYLLRTLLEGHGYEVEEAHNGAEALPLARKNVPDMIISDILMPEMDGFTLCQAVKKDGALKNVPFIFYTATYTDPRDEQFALGLGADAFIVKPVRPDDFLRRVEAALKAGRTAAPSTRIPDAEDEVILKEYNEVLVRKLEHKMENLELANRALQEEIAARKQAEERLRESEERYRLLFANSMDGVLLTEPSGRILKANRTACDIFGRDEEDILASGRSALVDASDPRLWPAVEERDRTGKFYGELTCLRKDGTKFPCEISSAIFTDGNGTMKTSMIVRDITERKKTEEDLVASLREKDALLQEIHHRVKNNMQLINGMINLQLNSRIETMSHDEIVTVASELQQRIRCMGLVHNLLYTSKNLSRIDFNEYVHTLVDSLSDVYHVHGRPIAFDMRITDEPISIVAAIPLGQIFNELISNALKYAFPDGRKGDIHLAMTIDDRRECSVSIRDNGVGFPDGFDIRTTSSLGLHLASLLVKQLGGTIENRNDNGAVIEIRFKTVNGKDRLEDINLEE